MSKTEKGKRNSRPPNLRVGDRRLDGRVLELPGLDKDRLVNIDSRCCRGGLLIGDVGGSQEGGPAVPSTDGGRGCARERRHVKRGEKEGLVEGESTPGEAREEGGKRKRESVVV